MDKREILKNWDEAYRKIGILQPEVMDIVKEAVDVFRQNNVQKVLDLGFGTGRHTVFLAKKGFEMYGTEVSEKGKEITEQRLKEAGLAAKLFMADMHRLPFENGNFDAVIAIYVIEYNTLAGLKETIAEIKRVLKPGGIFVGTLITDKDYKNGLGNEIERGTFINPEDQIESTMPHRITDEKEVHELFSEFTEISRPLSGAAIRRPKTVSQRLCAMPPTSRFCASVPGWCSGCATSPAAVAITSSPGGRVRAWLISPSPV